MIGFLFKATCIALDPCDSLTDLVVKSHKEASEKCERDRLQRITNEEVARLRAKKIVDSE